MVMVMVMVVVVVMMMMMTTFLCFSDLKTVCHFVTTGYVAASASRTHAVLLREDGHAVSWGLGQAGRSKSNHNGDPENVAGSFRGKFSWMLHGLR